MAGPSLLGAVQLTVRLLAVADVSVGAAASLPGGPTSVTVTFTVTVSESVPSLAVTVKVYEVFAS